MTMTWIGGATTTAGGFVDFNNIPQTFAHLQLRVHGSSSFTSGGTSGPLETWIGPNNTSGTTPTAGFTHRLYGDGSSAISNAQSQANLYNTPWLPYGFADTIVGSYIVDILDYNNTNKFKTIRAIGGYDANGSGLVTLHSGYANITAPIVQLRVAQNAGGFKAGGRIDLYGIGVSEQTGA